MDASNLIAWYQKKIGCYDEQVWEKRIEHKKYYRFSPVDLKSTNLKPGLIDLDLVKGSSFTKTKPKHGFLTVLKLATVRILFLPFHIKWWILQTSKKVAFFLLLTYVMQLCNILLYLYYVDKYVGNVEMQISSMEIIVPLIMMWMLCMIHSQIVATNPGSDKKHLKSRSQKNKKKFSRPNQNVKRNNEEKKLKKPFIIDDGFESFNGNGTSNSDNEMNRINLQNSVESLPSDLHKNIEIKRSNCIARNNKKIKIESESSNPIGWSCRRNKNVKFSSSSSNEENARTSSDSDTEVAKKPKLLFKKVRKSCVHQLESDVSDEDDLSNPSIGRVASLNGNILSTVECLGATTNSEEECSYASCLEDYNQCDSLFEGVPSCINSSEKVSCMIWHATEIKEASLTVLDIISAIITRVESVPENMDYFYFGLFLSTIIAITPSMSRIFGCNSDITPYNDTAFLSLEYFNKVASTTPSALACILNVSFGHTLIERTIIIFGAVQRWILSFLFFFLLSVAERTYKQRFLYAKFFSHLTSSRRARKSELPHFRLNKVLNIKIWLATRSYLKKKGPQRSVDIIVSAAFMIAFVLFLFISVDILPCNSEAIIWCIGLGIWMFRFMTLGTQINRKYVNRNLSILTTEQINLHLQIEQNSGRKEELTVANNVLKLAADLLKDMECPFQILGISANPYLYAVIKLVMLSALSGVLSDLLGFKLKLHKIKVK